MKPTKRAKKINLKLIKSVSYQTKYTCPTCKVEYHGFVGTNVIRFKCKCGQELIITSHIKEEQE